MIKYPSINQFKDVVRSVRDSHDYKGKGPDGTPIYSHTENYPVIKFLGTVKLHGTNASIVKYSDGRLEFQSRERILSLEFDNSNFMLEMLRINPSFLFDNIQFNDYCAVYGEWCGGSIQKGVAINALPKMFVIFGIKVDGEWVPLPPDFRSESNRIYNILQFPTYEVEIDFNTPELIQNKLIELTLAVEEKCPVGDFFGVEGVGEGIVFTAISDQSLKFKSKGEKHSTTKVRKLNPVDTEAMSSINEFVDYAVTENRLEQGITFFNENFIDVCPLNTGQFLSWVVKDVLKEEETTIVGNSLNVKTVKNAIVAKARVWFLTKCNEL
jgi:hypothetical protein